MTYRVTSILLLVLCLVGQMATASHVVSSKEIRAQIIDSAADRDSKIQTVERLLRHETIKAQLGGMADLEKLEQVLPALDDETLDQLAAESERVNDALEAGEVCAATIVLIVLIAAVIVVAIVAWA